MRTGSRTSPQTGHYLCPTCNLHSRTDVLDSRPDPSGYTRRRRYCNECKSKFSTLEIPMDSLPQLDLRGLGAKAAADLNAAVQSFNLLNRALKAAAKRVSK